MMATFPYITSALPSNQSRIIRVTRNSFDEAVLECIKAGVHRHLLQSENEMWDVKVQCSIGEVIPIIRKEPKRLAGHAQVQVLARIQIPRIGIELQIYDDDDYVIIPVPAGAHEKDSRFVFNKYRGHETEAEAKAACLEVVERSYHDMQFDMGWSCDLPLLSAFSIQINHQMLLEIEAEEQAIKEAMKMEEGRTGTPIIEDDN